MSDCAAVRALQGAAEGLRDASAFAESGARALRLAGKTGPTLTMLETEAEAYASAAMRVQEHAEELARVIAAIRARP